MEILYAIIVIVLYLLIGYVIGFMYSYINEEDFDDNIGIALMWPLPLIIDISWCFLKLIRFIAKKIVFILILNIELIKAKKKIKDSIEKGDC